MKVCIISGSARANNNTIRVGKALKRLHQQDETVLIDFQAYDIPMIAQGAIDLNNPFQRQLAEALQGPALVYIITPEYNWSTTPEILNWLHRFGDHAYKDQFDEKVFALVGVSTGKGGKAPLLHLTGVLHKIISYLDLNSVNSAKIFESHYTKEVLNAEGESLGNAEYDNALSRFVSYTKRIATRWLR